MTTVKIEWNEDIKEKYKGKLLLGSLLIKNCTISKNIPDTFKKHEEETFAELRSRFTLDQLKNDPIIRAYRDFYWSINIDPTKQRPAGEALLRRILRGNKLWEINSLVNAYNLASAITRLSLGAYDLAKFELPLRVRMARDGETFKGIGMKEAKPLKSTDILLVDNNDMPLSICPYRDADATKVETSTKDVLLIAYGVPGIQESIIRDSLEQTLRIITKAVPHDTFEIGMHHCL